MGSALSSEVLAAFVQNVAEMEKQALNPPGGKRLFGRAISHLGEHAKGFIGDLQEAGRRAFAPFSYGLPKGWEESALRTSRKEMSGEAIRKAKAALEKPRKGFIGRHIPENILPRWFGREGAHTYQNINKPVPLGDIITGKKGDSRVRRIAEELSRRGWTGKGNITKYLPVGTKGMTGVFTAAEIPGVVTAPEATPTGEGSKVEKGLGLVGGLGGMIAGTGVGMLPGLALYSAGHYAGGKAGRILDRLRAGGSLSEAVGAPSPEEATEQISKIRKYYG